MKFLLIVSLSCCSLLTFGQDASIIDFAALEERMKTSGAELQIVNFWATWCGPCVKELPYFDAITKRGNPAIQVTLVSLDLDLNPDPERVNRFVRKRGIQSEVVLLNEADPNIWIPKIDSTWSGALPATLILNRRTGQRIFIDRALKEHELEQYLVSGP